MRYKTTTIKWFDAASKSEWHKGADAGSLTAVYTTGWLARESDQFIVLCNSYTEDGDVGDCITIPKPWIEDDRDTSDDVQPEPDAEAVHREQGEG